MQLHFRQAIEKCVNYDQANDLLRTCKLIAPAYFLLIGIDPKQGTIITRERSPESSRSESFQGQIGYLGQTNIDMDLQSDLRYETIKRAFEKPEGTSCEQTEKSADWLKKLTRMNPIENEKTFTNFVICPRSNLFMSSLVECPK